MAKFLLMHWRRSLNLSMRFSIPVWALALCALAASPAPAQKHYDAGASDTEIVIGQEPTLR